MYAVPVIFIGRYENNIKSKVAIKWCTACDDPFCGPCWANIHSRGMRSKHNYCTISPAGRVSAKATAPDGTDAGPYTPGDSLKAETAGVQGGGGETALVDVASPVPVRVEVVDQMNARSVSFVKVFRVVENRPGCVRIGLVRSA